MTQALKAMAAAWENHALVASIRRYRWRAFTLVELVLVIALISCLAALLLSALTRAKHQAQNARCLNNQRQLTTVWLMYTADHDDWLVPNGGYPAGPPPTRAGRFALPRLWVQGAFIHAPALTNRLWLLDPEYAAFADYVRSLPLYVCPADNPMVMAFGQRHPRLRSYALNAYLGWAGQWDPRLASGYKVYRKQCQLTGPPPAGTFLFQDVQADSICFPFFGVYVEVESFYNFPGAAHQKRGIVAFADGHVEGHRWRDARTLTAISDEYHRHDDASPNNPDLVWLRERTTSKR